MWNDQVRVAPFIELAEQFTAPSEFFIDPGEHAHPEFAIALDGNDPGVGQPHGSIALELDAFLEVDEIEFDVVRTTPERKVGYEDVKQG